MHTSSLTDLAAFQPHQAVWDRVHAQDPQATVYTSHAWLSGWLAATTSPWTVLVFRPKKGAEPVAFAALSLKPQRSRLRRTVTVRFAGQPMTNHTGLVCLPGHEAAVIAALAKFIRAQRTWTALHLRYTLDPRVDDLAAQLSGAFELSHDRADANPYLRLPDSYDAYLATQFSSKTQRRMRNQLRKAEEMGCFTTEADSTTLECHVAAFLELHQKRFGEVAPRYVNMYRALFASTAAAGCLRLRVMWCAERPVAAEVGFADEKRRVYYAFQGGWDEEFAAVSPGQILMQDDICWAIERGFEVLDYGQGEYAYKYALGAQSSSTDSYRLRRRSVREQLLAVVPSVRERVQKLAPAHPKADAG